MTVYAKSRDAELYWFLDFLNSVIRIESPRLRPGRRLPVPDARKSEKTNKWQEQAAISPDGVRSAAAAITGVIVTHLNAAIPWTADDEDASRDLQSVREPVFYLLDRTPARVTKFRAHSFEIANLLAKQAMVRFEHDAMGNIEVKKIVGPSLPPSADFHLLSDALNVLANLIQRGFLPRIRSCVGRANALHRGAEPRRCRIWFENRRDAEFHDRACEKRTERQRNKRNYYARHTARERRAREKDARG